jgi:foldase protein PrsA
MALMRHASIKMFCVLAVTGIGAAVVTGCGNDVPPNAVAKVGDSVITQDEFDKWMKTASAGQAQGGAAPATPDPPDFKKCVAAKKKQPVPKGQDKPSDSQLKKQCKQQFDQLKTEVMQFLIQSEWVQQEADAQGVKVTDKEIKRSFEDQKKQAFPTDKAYQQFLKSSGMTEADILFRVKLDQLQKELTQKVTKDSKKVSDQDVAEYYDKNKKRFAQPERRDLLVVLTKTKAKADQAMSALQGGQSFKSVAKKFSIDQASKNQGGRLLAVAKGQQEKALDDAVFKAPKSKLEGPVKTQFGYYVFKVTKVTPASQQTLTQATPTIKQLLQSQNQQKALDDFVKDFQKRWKDKTDCRSGFVTQDCKNAPKAKTTSTVAPGSTQQNAPPANSGTTTGG